MHSIVYFSAFVVVFGYGAMANTVKFTSNLAETVAHTTCKSGDDTIGPKDLKDSENFTFDFSPSVFGNTLFFCDMTTDDGKKAHFDAWKDGDAETVGYFYKPDGIYKGDVDGNEIEKLMDYE